MSVRPYITKLIVYPVKSLDRVEVDRATVLPSGALAGDREFALFDERDRFVNGKRHAKIHHLRSQFDFNTYCLSLRTPETNEEVTFSLESDRAALETWLSDWFQFSIKVKRNMVMGFPDDIDSPGPTIISTATIETVASWFPGVDGEDMRRRLRANVEIDGVPAFWEDRLFAESDRPVPFHMGEVLIEGINPCQRCVVPTRDPVTAAAYPNFQKIFMNKREATLPAWIHRDRFNHFYRLSINTRIPTTEAGKVLRVGDIITYSGTEEIS
ncbi:MAG: MOSC domain-containing protein [Coleofasciculaceae cyanobacterium SM2_3_26]|nr:MOSC domain-containing protein [Coleofasciculaceae cyanobacterium SM2_3_26]